MHNYSKFYYDIREPWNYISDELYELKYFDSSIATTAISQITLSWSVGVLNPTGLNTLFLPRLGTDIDKRIGRRVAVHSMIIRGSVTFTASSSTTSYGSRCQVRIVFLINRHTDNAVLDGNDVLSSSNSINGINFFQNLGSIGKYLILDDIMLDDGNLSVGILSTDTAVQASDILRFQFVHTFETPLLVHFSADNGNVTDILDNSFHLLVGRNSNSISPTIIYDARFCYIDV